MKGNDDEQLGCLHEVGTDVYVTGLDRRQHHWTNFLWGQANCLKFKLFGKSFIYIIVCLIIQKQAGRDLTQESELVMETEKNCSELQRVLDKSRSLISPNLQKV